MNCNRNGYLSNFFQTHWLDIITDSVDCQTGICGKLCFVLLGGDKGRKFQDYAYILDVEKRRSYSVREIDFDSIFTFSVLLLASPNARNCSY